MSEPPQAATATITGGATSTVNQQIVPLPTSAATVTTISNNSLASNNNNISQPVATSSRPVKRGCNFTQNKLINLFNVIEAIILIRPEE